MRPMAIERKPVAEARLPRAVAPWPDAIVLRPKAVALKPEAFAFWPNADEFSAALAPRPNVGAVLLKLATTGATVEATEYSWLPLIASVDVAVTRPAATFWIWRSAPGAPTDTTPTGDVPAKPVYA